MHLIFTYSVVFAFFNYILWKLSLQHKQPNIHHMCGLVKLYLILLSTLVLASSLISWTTQAQKCGPWSYPSFIRQWRIFYEHVQDFFIICTCPKRLANLVKKKNVKTSPQLLVTLERVTKGHSWHQWQNSYACAFSVWRNSISYVPHNINKFSRLCFL